MARGNRTSLNYTMIKVIFLISVLLFIPSISSAGIGDVYYCEALKENAIINNKLKTYKNSKFKFKRYKKKIIINGGAFGKGFEMDVNFDNGKEYFAGVYEESISIFLYEDNTFIYTGLSSSDAYIINNLYANCSIFK